LQAASVIAASATGPRPTILRKRKFATRSFVAVARHGFTARPQKHILRVPVCQNRQRIGARPWLHCRKGTTKPAF